MEKIVEFAYLFVTDVIRYIADESTAERLLQRMNSSMQILYSHVNQKVEEIYQNVSHSYPITYNHYFTENLRKAQQQRQEEDIRIALEPFSREGQIRPERGSYYSTDNIVRAILATKDDPDMDRYASQQSHVCHASIL